MADAFSQEDPGKPFSLIGDASHNLHLSSCNPPCSATKFRPCVTKRRQAETAGTFWRQLVSRTSPAHGVKRWTRMSRGYSAALRTGLAIAFFNAALVSPVSAAKQGEISAVSSGSISITVSVAPKIKSIGLQGSYPLPNKELALRNGCILSNAANSSYGVLAEQRSGSSRLAWSDSSGRLRELPMGTTVEGLESDSDDQNCKSGLQASFAEQGGSKPIEPEVITILLVPL